MKLSITKQALKAIAGLDAKQYKQVGSTIFGLFNNTEPHDSKALKGAEHGERRVAIASSNKRVRSASSSRVES